VTDRLKSVAALAAPSAAIGVFLFQQGFKRTGWAFASLAIIIVALGLLSLLIPALLRLLEVLSTPVWRLIRGIFQLTIHVYRRCVMGLARTVLGTDDGAMPLSWTAQEKRIYMSAQNADFKVLSGPLGKHLRGLEFTVRPDYGMQYWRAGFRLGPRGENFKSGNILETCLFHIANDGGLAQPQTLLYLNRAQPAIDGLRHGQFGRCPAFVVRATFWRTGNNQAVMSATVDMPDAWPREVQFDLAYTEQVVLMAWADGGPFRVHFDDVKVFWE